MEPITFSFVTVTTYTCFARFLADKGAVLVGASDSNGTLADPGGLDVAALIALKDTGRPLPEHAAGRKLDADATIDVPCDIWITAAHPTSFAPTMSHGYKRA